VVATIRDNGPGIPAAVADRIFDPFFTTKADRQGTGLGLSICYGIVNAHGGRIWADSIEGQGAAFSVVLPVTTVEAPSHGEAPPPPEPAAPAGRHVLILEDEVEIARLMARYLERLGYRASVAHEARAALQMIAEESPDLVLTDLKMPGMSGREFYAELRKTCPELAERVIFVTGDTVSPDTQSFLKQIGRPHLAKPFSLEEVRAAVAAALG
jgi:two-component system NtrC family sensor kinase